MKKINLMAGLLVSMMSVSAVAKTTVVVSGWGGDNVVVLNDLVNKVLADDLEKADLHIKYQSVEGDFYQYITNALAAGTAPDIFYMDVVNANALINSGKVAANSEAFKTLESLMLPQLNAAFTFNGKQYGIAKDFNALAIQFNKDIFDDAQVEYPSSNDSWQDLRQKLIAVKRALNDEVTGVCLIPAYERFAPFALSTGWKPFTHEGKTVLDEDFRRAFRFYTSLVTEDHVAVLMTDKGQSWGGGCFGKEETAITLEGNWLSGYLRDKAPNLRYGTTLLPKDDKTGQRGNLLFTVAWGINAASKNQQAMQKAVEILSSEKAQRWVLESGLALPGRTELGKSDYFTKEKPENEMSRVIFNASQEGFVEPYAFGRFGTDWKTPIDDALNAVMTGQMSEDEALKIAQDKYNKMAGK